MARLDRDPHAACVHGPGAVAHADRRRPLLDPLYTAVSWVLLRWHQLFSTFLPFDSGLTWALSILMLVVTIRILLFRFFIKQVHSQRKMQQMQPKIQALREKYKNDRQTLSQEMMKLQKEEGFNPLGGCLPILLQAPIFLSLFHVLRIVRPDAPALYGWTEQEAHSAGRATLFGAPIATSFNDTNHLVPVLHASMTSTHIVTFVLIVLMCAATYITQRQIMRTSGQVLEGQQAMIQKMLLYGMPISLFFSGFFFPLGVLLYWFTNNLWTMGQQFYILHRHPHPDAVNKKDEKPAIDPKLLAPKPGQKPVNPKARRPAANPPATPKPATPKPSPAESSPAESGPSQPPGPAESSPAESSPAESNEPVGSVDGSGPSSSGGSSAGPTSTSRPARRPPGQRQRSSTTTRPKKKRR
jgi:YidC/Oxa1 family membrane protein insertase